jgi:hypothetical protein
MSSWLAAAPLELVRTCADTASAALKGMKALEAACPGLQDALASTGFDEILIDGWQQKLNVHALADMSELAQHYSRSQWRAPDTSALPTVLESLQEKTPRVASWWQSFKTWLKDWLSRSDSSLASWLNRLLERWSAQTEMSVTILKIFAFCLTAVVVMAAVLIVVREIRAIRLGQRGREGTKAESSNRIQAGLEAGVVPSSVTDALAELLRELVSKLLQLGRLGPDRSLTHRELVKRSVFGSEEQRGAFAAVAHGAEANFYGPRDEAPESADEVKRRGEALLAQLTELKSRS